MIKVQGQISYPSHIGVVYEDDTKEAVAVAIIKHMAAIEAYAINKSDTKTNSYELTMNALKHMLGEVITLTSEEQSADDCKETMIVSKALNDIANTGYKMCHEHDATEMSAETILSEFASSGDPLCVNVWKGSRLDNSQHNQSFVLFVPGNGECVISDYGGSLEDVLKEANALAGKLE